MADQPSHHAPRRLGVGDGIAIVALLGFIVGWVALMLWHVDLDPPAEGDDGDWADAVAMVIVLWIVIGPPLWASSLVKQIVKGSGSSGE